MDSVVNDLEQLKLSALHKLQIINSSYVSKSEHVPESTEKEIKLRPPKAIKNIDPALEPKSVNEIENVITKLEIERHQDIKSRIRARISIFEDFTKLQESNTKQQWLRIQQNFERENQQKENSIFLAMQEFDQNSSNSHAKLAQYYQNLRLRRQMQEQELKMREQQKQMMHNCIDKIKKHQQDFNEAYEQVILLLKQCNDEVKNKLVEQYKLLKAFHNNFEKIITKCRTQGVSEEDEKQASQTLNQVQALGIKMKEIVEEAVKKNEEAKIPTETEVVPDLPTTEPPVKPVPVPNQSDLPKVQTSVSSITRYISLSNLKMYTDIMEFFNKHTDSFKNLLEDASQKQFRFDCKKAINLPVNSLSGVNSEHILDKFNRLKALLNGQDVAVGNDKINASKHPQGVPFCMDLLAKKFVLQGDLMVSSNPDSAFCYASVMSSLWNEFPTFGQLLLAHFYKSCPYLVPYCIPREVGESDEEFYSRLGYQYKDGQIENQDKFLKRMTGIMRLYAAMMIVKPKKDHKSNPHKIHHGWRWFSSVMKLEPQVDITATMLHTFLETVGFEMEAKYGLSFRKLIMVLVDKFLPSCREKCTGGATTRLELLLTNYFKSEKFEKPNGYLDYRYW
nr:nucleoporin GLE1 [Leptinotarsa decemlineata]